MNLLFYAYYLKAGVGTAPSSAPTITICSVNRGTGDQASVVSGGTMTALPIAGMYFYRLTSADLQTYDYPAAVHTSDTTVDSQDAPSLWVRWSEAVATDTNGKVSAKIATGDDADAASVKATLASGVVLATVQPNYAPLKTLGTTAPANWLNSAAIATDAINTIQGGLATTANQSALLTAIGTPVQTTAMPTWFPSHFTNATFSADGVFAETALAAAPTGGGGTAQTGDLYALVNPLIASGAFTGPALANTPRSGYSLTTPPPTSSQITTAVVAGMATAPVGSVTGSVGSVTGSVGSVVNLTGLSINGGTVSNNATPSALTFTATGLSSGLVTGDLNGQTLIFQTGNRAGVRRTILTHIVTNEIHAFTLASAMGAAPAVGDTFEVC